MTSPGPLPTLRFYERADCHLCDDARQALQAVLEERVMAGAVVPRVHPIDVAGDEQTERDYGHRVPVLEIHGRELSLAMGQRAIRRFLAEALDARLA
jgi:peroxiredoxin